MASRFWVGGSGTWDAATTTHWSATSGGAGSASVPTAADDVVFDANSGGGTVTMAISQSMLTINTTGFAGVITSSLLGLNIYGAFATFGPGTITNTGVAQFVSSPTPVTITLTPGGNTFSALTQQPVGTASGTSGFTLAGALTVSGAISINNGTFNTGNFSVTCGSFVSSNANVRTLTFGSSTITVSGTGTAWNAGTTSNLTVTGTPTITLSGAGATFISGGSYNWGNLVLSGSGVQTVSGTNTFANLTRNGTATKTDGLNVGNNQVVTGTLTLNGNSVTNRLLVQSNATGTARTITAPTVVASNVDFQDITGAGTGNWNLSAIAGGSGDAGGNTSITFTPSATQYAKLTANGNWSSAIWFLATAGTGGAGRVPLPQDDVVVDVNSGAFTLSQDMPRMGRSLNFTGFTGTLGLNASTSVYGSVTWGTGMTITGSSGMTLVGRGAYTITSNGKQFSAGMTVNTFGGSYSLVDALSTAAAFSVTSGTFTATTQTVTATAFTSPGSTTRAVNMGSGAWTLTGTSGSVWTTASTGLTLNVSTAVVTLTGAGTSTITTGGVTMPSVTFNGPGGTDTLADAFTTAGTITLSAGTFDTSSFAVTCLTFFSGVSTTRTLTLGSSTITITNPSSSGWNVQGGTGLTITANTATVVTTGTNGGFTAPSSAFNWNGLSLVLSGTGATAINNGTQTFANLTRNGTAAKTDTLSLSANIVVTGTLTLNSNSATNRLLVQSNVVGTQRTITAANVVISNVVDFQDIAGAGAATWTVAGTGATYLGDALGNSGITFTPSATQYRVGTSSVATLYSDVTKWASTSGGVGGTGRVPLPQDDVVFDNNTPLGAPFNIATTWDMPRLGRTIDWTAYTAGGSIGGPSTLSVTVYGSWLQTVAFNASPNQALVLAGRGNNTFQSPNTMGGGVVVNCVGGSYTLAGALVTGSAANLTHTSGTFSTGVYSVTIGGAYNRNSSIAGTLNMGSGIWTFTSTSTITLWSVSGGTLTLNPGTATIVIASASANTRTIQPAGLTMPDITYTVAGSTGTLAITSSGTIGTLSVGAGRTVTFGAGTITTIGGWNVNGTAGNPTAINSTTAGTQATLRPTAGATLPFTSDYLSLKDIAAQSAAGGSGTGLWYAGANSVDSGNNTGWTFTAYAFVGSGSAVLTLSAGSSLPETSWSDGGAAALSLISSASDALLFADTAPAALSLAAAASTSLRFSDTAAAALALMAAATADVRWGDSGTAALNLLAAAAALPSYADLGGASLDVLAQATGVPTWFASGAASLALLLSGRGTLLLARDIDVIFGDPKLEGLTAGAPIISALGVGGNTVAALAFGTPTVEGVTVGTPTV